jgi:hypothetical protein
MRAAKTTAAATAAHSRARPLAPEANGERDGGGAELPALHAQAQTESLAAAEYRIPEVEICTQTEPEQDRPSTPIFVPQSSGDDVGTQIEVRARPPRRPRARDAPPRDQPRYYAHRPRARARARAGRRAL